MSYADDLKIFMNILAQSPDGMGDAQLIGKFAKAKAGLNMMASMNEMQSQNVTAPIPPQPVMDTSNNTVNNAGSMPQSSDGLPPDGSQMPI